MGHSNGSMPVALDARIGHLDGIVQANGGRGAELCFYAVRK